MYETARCWCKQDKLQTFSFTDKLGTTSTTNCTCKHLAFLFRCQSENKKACGAECTIKSAFSIYGIVGLFTLSFGSCLGWFHSKNTCIRFSTGAFRVGGLKEELKQVQGFAKVRGEMESTEPDPASAAPTSSCSAAVG